MNKSKLIKLGLATYYAVGAIHGARTIKKEYVISTDKVTSEVTIAQIADYHSMKNKLDQNRILNIVSNNSVDYIVLNGDILDEEDHTGTVEFIAKLGAIAPVLFARGNHDGEWYSYDEFVADLKDIGVHIINNDKFEAGEVTFIGYEDTELVSVKYDQLWTAMYKQDIVDKVSPLVNENTYNVLLGHRPPYLDAYSKTGVDLVFSGHAHGGQWQLPFTDIAVLAPDEGMIATNVHGLKHLDGTKQIISSGVSNPYGPVIPRLYNPKEVVITRLIPNQK